VPVEAGGFLEIESVAVDGSERGRTSLIRAKREKPFYICYNKISILLITV